MYPDTTPTPSQTLLLALEPLRIEEAPSPGLLAEVLASDPSSMRTAAAKVAQDAAAARSAKLNARRAGKPKLSRANLEAYLDWVTDMVVGEYFNGSEAAVMLRAAELVVSSKHAASQGKATEHAEAIEGEPPIGDRTE